MKFVEAGAVFSVLILLSTSGFAQSDAHIDFDTEQYLCAVSFTPSTEKLSSEAVNYKWDFGDGETSHERAPVHQFKNNGRYSVTLTIDDNLRMKISKTKKIRFQSDKKLSFVSKPVEVTTRQCDNVINAEMYTFVDQPFGNQPFSTPITNQEHIGVWKRGKTYEYVTQRSDGVYSVPDSYSTGPMLQDGWRESINLIDGISSVSVNASVLKDKTQSHIIAECVNARQDEIAYTGFESQSLTTGNWTFSSDIFYTRRFLPLISGYKNFMLVELDPSKASDVKVVEINVISTENSPSHRQIVPVLCHQTYEKNKNWSVLILGSVPQEGSWTGDVHIPFTVQQDLSGILLDHEVSHSGGTSLRTVKTTRVNQPLLNLTAKQEYIISLWVSSESSRKRNTMVEGAGIEVSFADAKGQTIQSISFRPSGLVMEGWQQISSKFTVPEQFSTLSIKFITPDVSWFDDLRLYPADGNMRTFVYDPIHNKRSVVLDENNRATFFYYSDHGLFQQKKETDGGIRTMRENVQYTKSNQ